MTGRIIEIIVLVILIAITAYYWSKSKKQAEELAKNQEKPEDVKIIQTFKIEGMMCPKCSASVTEALGKFGNVDVDLEAKTATITADELCDEKEIEEIISGLGFEYKGMIQ